MILNNAHYSGAEIFIQRLNSILLQEQVHADNVTQSSFPLFTVSAGISQNVKGLNISEIITKADIELLNVKKSTVSEM
ncbi:MAG: hypothetical protein KGV50_07560 [Gammaproteobacteria bacterium]|nr:hypothetical protein [Gammaproteobacteria bacterium]